MNCAALRAIKRAPCSQEVMSSLRSVPQGKINGKCFHPAICGTTTNDSCDKDGIKDVCWLIVFALTMHCCDRDGDNLPWGFEIGSYFETLNSIQDSNLAKKLSALEIQILFNALIFI